MLHNCVRANVFLMCSSHWYDLFVFVVVSRVSPAGLCRYTTKAMLVKLFQELRAHSVKQAGGSEACSKFFLGRGSSATSGVEGFYTPDGIQNAHLFLWRAEGPKDVVEICNHFLVSTLQIFLKVATLR